MTKRWAEIRKQEAVALADRVVKYRAKHNLSMKGFADMCGVCWQTIFNLENLNYKVQRITQAKIEMILGDEEQ